MDNNYEMNKVRFAMDGIDTTLEVVEVQKEEVERRKHKRILKKIEGFQKRDDMGYGALILAVKGYDDVPEELCEIKEVRKYFKSLLKKVPHLLFFTNPMNQIHIQILFSLGDYTKYYKGSLDPDEYKKGKHQAKSKLTPGQIQEHIDAIESYLKSNGVDPSIFENEKGILSFLHEWKRNAEEHGE